MQNELQVLVPESADGMHILNNLSQFNPLQPLNPEILAMLTGLSKSLLQAKYKQHPEIVALGFWLRNMLRDAPNQLVADESTLIKALGLAVHFTPSNVDTMFMYSWVCSALMGNNNVVRLASTETQVQALLIAELRELFKQPNYGDLAARNIFVRTDKASAWTARLSLLADARLLWGGDDSVQAIRALASKPRTRDISFSDRYSAALIHSDALDGDDQIDALAERLWNDTQPHLQQACSSPRVVYWLGDTSKMQTFFAKVDEYAKQRIEPTPQLRNEQLVYSQFVAATAPAQFQQYEIISVIEVADPAAAIEYHAGQMTYLLVPLSSLEQITSQISDKLQTLTYAGIQTRELIAFLSQPELQGVDRVAAIGQALDFMSVWDGMDLFAMLSRRVSIR
ncbi:acyl-CoA reductase [Alteromonas flava]|uniref:acyl-CoA reductase n=1 Tax=Alteromonas flava TaxID=2048003 RepID=UPI000C288CA1|nr:acyl-CoA reductase [Alteromonas flava]